MLGRITASSAIGVGPLPVIWESCEVALSSKCSYLHQPGTQPANHRDTSGSIACIKTGDRSDSDPHTVSRIQAPERTASGSQPHGVDINALETIVSTGTATAQPNSQVEQFVVGTKVRISSLDTPATKDDGANGFGRVLATAVIAN